jgi:alpha-glucosidase (family GH31 glycosyl hydrolase)
MVVRGRLLGLALVVPLLSVPLAGTVPEVAAASSHSYKLGRVTVRVTADPFSVALLRHGRPLATFANGKGPDRGALHAKQDGTWYGSTTLASVRAGRRAIRLTAHTTGPDLRMTLRQAGKGRFTLTVRGPSAATDVGVTVPIASAGHWYGGGETKFQPWPMDKGGQFDFTAPWPNDATFWFQNKGSNRPYATSDNGWDVETPFWYTSSGFGLFKQTLQDVDFAFDSSDDGSFVLGDPHSATFRSRVYTTRNALATFRKFQADLGPRSPLPPAALSMSAKPIWTTWAEFKGLIDQATVLQFADDIVAHQLPHGTMEIDDKWNAPAAYYAGAGWGEMEFDPSRFPDPKGMVDELHAKGFQVTLWIPPFVDLYTTSGAEAVQNGYCVKTPQGDPYLIKWWDNFNSGSCLIDFSNRAAGEWWAAKLHSLQTRYGIDGFKFDGGEANFVPKDAVTAGKITSNQYADVYMHWAAVHGFDVHEMRAAWLGQAQGRIVREFDKDTVWGLQNGLSAVITQALALSAVGYPYQMPDMIGGNQYNGDLKDAELLTRWIELSAFMEMMQFSIRPWPTSQHPSFTPELTSVAKSYSELFDALLPYRTKLFALAHRTGMPVIRPLLFAAPNRARARTAADEWLLGPDLLAAPVVTQGATSRDVYLPPGRWRPLGGGKVIKGGRVLQGVPAGITQTPAYYRVGGKYSALLRSLPAPGATG